MDDDNTDLVVCCETPMLCIEDRDSDGRLYWYYVCLQCGCETDEVEVSAYGSEAYEE